MPDSSASSPSLTPPRGMRDFFPEDMALQNRIVDAWRAASTAFGFSEYGACVVESLDLIKRKAGEEIVGQIYDFQDKQGRALALRPEMTPTLARMVASRQAALTFPLKWFTVAQCFRYERMTKGRRREHYQWNLDVIGDDSALAEAEVVAAALDALSRLGLGLSHVRVYFSSRALLGDLLMHLGIDASCHPAVFLALDKRGKLDEDEIGSLLAKGGLDTAAADRVFELMAIDGLDPCEEILGGSTPALDHVRAFRAALALYGLEDFLRFDLSIVRGLAYYTGIVFEAFNAERTSRAVFGGGRYDNLLADIGGKPATGVGLGFGDVVVTDLLADAGLADTAPVRTGCSVGYMQDGQRAFAMQTAVALRRNGTNVDLSLKPEKAKAFFSRAAKAGWTEAAYIGPDDVQSGSVRIKDLATREERVLKIEK